ncbi:unnamed protein product [Adineta steineri]|uniref:VWFA domain-containing protein n=1 Tax=Adineta steineri TaxID=433720 RepID=A0A813Y725_9BILA|nr:unnamed protein product [Adineta steineri]
MYPQQYPPTAPPPAYPSNQVGFNSLSQTNDERMSKFQYLVNLYEINREFATRLRGLEGYEIAFIVDDSGSMNTPLGDLSGPFDHNPTRWDELRRTVSIVVDIASVFDPDGVDIFFLNREPMRNVKNAEELKPVFAMPPSGPTPIARVLRHVLQAKQLEVQERKLLILIATDGIPTNDSGQQDTKTLENVLRHERKPINRIPVTIIASKQLEVQERKLLILIATDGIPTNDSGQQDTKTLENVLRHERKPINRIPVTIIACTDDDECIGYLNNWDKKIPNLDVADDYKSERTEIHKVQGKEFPFSFGDYVVKVLMGAVDDWFDTLDERRVTGSGPPDRHGSKGKKSKCCIS